MSKCFECQQLAVHNHHVVPQVMGGKRTIPLCERCHGLVHDRDFLHHRNLTQLGLEKAKRAGKSLGRPVSVDSKTSERICAEVDAGRGWSAVARSLNADNIPTANNGVRWYPSTVRQIYLRTKRRESRA